MDRDSIDSSRGLSPLVMVRIDRRGVGVRRLDVTEWIDTIDTLPDEPMISADRAALEALLELAAGSAPDELTMRLSERLALDVSKRASLEAFVARVVEMDTRTGDRCARPAGRRTRPGSVAAMLPAEFGDELPPLLTCVMPVNLVVGPDGFMLMNHDGWALEKLSPIDVLVAATFGDGSTAVDVLASLTDSSEVANWELTEDGVVHIIERLVRCGLLRRVTTRPEEQMVRAVGERLKLLVKSTKLVEQIFVDARERAARTGTRLPVVLAFDIDPIPMLGLGLTMSYAQVHDSGALTDRYIFAPLWQTDRNRTVRLLSSIEQWPTVVLFSHYVWNTEANLELSAAVKELWPQAVTIHGGPCVPKYDADARSFQTEHMHVDVAIRGEGELTLAETLGALATSWSERGFDLSVLEDVSGLTFRTRLGGLVRTPDRERIVDLDVVPSPYLDGSFEHVDRLAAGVMIVESNRGCPYGCTFCDWGSNTLSRIRKFDIERVKAEMEYGAARGVNNLWMADANFGVLDRDVELAQWAVELKARYGSPRVLYCSLAKNRVSNLTTIVQTLKAGGIETLSIASVQSFDEDVLLAINRTNIKIERYDALIEEFRQNERPIFTDIMVGVPGATVRSTKNDIQMAIDRELQVRLNATQLLVNSPMNAPEYRTEHGIVARPGDYVMQTSTFTQSDWIEMMSIRRIVYHAERCGLARRLAMYIRCETGIREVDFYDQLRTEGAERSQWPYVSYFVTIAPDDFVPPGSWWNVIAELGQFAVEVMGVRDDGALQSVLLVEHALYPAWGRLFPFEQKLEHDVVAWNRDVLALKRGDSSPSWHLASRPLREYGPGALVVRDDEGLCDLTIGSNTHCNYGEVEFELDSPVMRPRVKRVL